MWNTLVKSLPILVICMVISGYAARKEFKPVTSPPEILIGELGPQDGGFDTGLQEREQAYKIGEQTEIECKATGEPMPAFYWERNGHSFDHAADPTIEQKTVSEGTLIFRQPEARHEGIYQCFAKNEFGIAASAKVLLKKAYLMPFPTVTSPKIHRPLVGSPLSMNCSPPASYPSGLVYWAEDKPGVNKIEESDRISIDYNGNFYLANVLMEDALDGTQYICITEHRMLGGLMKGNNQKIEPQSVDGTPEYTNVALTWSSQERQIALKGYMVKMKCIFYGLPTPEVTWTRIGKPMPTRARITTFGKELIIRNVDYDDEGQYQCRATNNGESWASQDFTLEVQSKPQWRQRPERVNQPEEDDAEFLCSADGAPRPEITWSFNGVPYDPSQAVDRIEVTENRIYFKNLTKTDAQVIQCNASNEHGYIYTNAYLNVLAEPPSFIESPDPVTKVAEEQDVTLKCSVFGAPKPVVVWKYGDPPEPVTGARFEQQESGDLLIRDIRIPDRDNYTCIASNKYDTIQATGAVIVRQKTVIIQSPMSKTVNASTDVTFHCSATTDPAEAVFLKITWLRNGEEIDFTREGRISMNMQDNSLTIRQSAVEDTAEYTCKADNGIDSDEVSVSLTVKDRPDPPTNIKLLSCSATRAEVQWQPGNENGDAVTEFILYYNTSFDEPGEFHEGDTVDHSRTSASVNLSPWTNYTFHVRARNSLGLSDRSAFTEALCTSPQRRPYKNPDNVCVASERPDQLVIVWDTMQPIDHNGEGFRYVVTYERDPVRPVHTPLGGEQTVEVTDWRQNRLVVEDQPVFVRYRFSVVAKNNKGTTPEGREQFYHGYSGEDTPLVRPEGFKVDEDTLNATSAMFSWKDIPDRLSSEDVRGHFKGYRIVFWKSSNPEDKREEDVILSPVQLCQPLRGDQGRKRRQAESDSVTAHTHDLWPYSKITAGVQVLNNAQAGELSDLIEFETPEGVPGSLPYFAVTERGSHHFKLEWLPPSEPNGILIGYTLGYKAVESGEQMSYVQVPDPTRLHKKLYDLEEDTLYMLYIWGLTGAGMGEMQFIEARTKVAAPPDPPIIGNMEIGHDFVNTSWTPTDKTGDDKNPGSEFYIKYRKVGDKEWEDTKPPEREHNWINITDLDHGVEYEIIVVAVNGKGQETDSETVNVKVGYDPEAVTAGPSVATWFIVLMIILIFLVIVIIVICLIRRNRGGKYPVHEKEKLAGCDPDKEDEEAGFGEYTPKSEPEKKKSRTSLNSEEKPLGESDTDSMAEYYETDPSKFNEDGSFIGQYGGKKKAEPDTTSPSALSTFV